MASKKAVSQSLRDLRAATGMSPARFAAALSTSLEMLLIPPWQLLRWEAGKGPSYTYRTLLAPVLTQFRRDLDEAAKRPE